MRQGASQRPAHHTPVTSNSANTESTVAAITGAKSTDEFPDGRACFRELMSDVNLFAVMFNLHAEIIYCNGHFILMTGPAVDEVMGRGWNEIFASPGMCDSPCPSRIGRRTSGTRHSRKAVC